jgi:hypothetical protein
LREKFPQRRRIMTAKERATAPMLGGYPAAPIFDGRASHESYEICDGCSFLGDFQFAMCWMLLDPISHETYLGLALNGYGTHCRKQPFLTHKHLEENE